jgi:hypothetical protein
MGEADAARLKTLNADIEKLSKEEKEGDFAERSKAGKKLKELLAEREALMAKHGEGFHKLN